MMNTLTTMIFALSLTSCNGIQPQGELHKVKSPPLIDQRQDRPVNPRRMHQLKDLEVVTVKIGTQRFKSFVMDTSLKRQEGMMFLQDKEVRTNEGMLFAFPDSDDRSFWMQNTYIPLDIAYISKNKRIVSVHTMRPLDESGVPSAGPAMYALEVKAGTFRKYGIKAGQKVEFPASVKGS